uniref:Uncharacterized protein n=1 Tax=Cyanistes caeruleus TaxID=156563 RepID=A0A8C0ZCQ6_CYACU
WCPFVFMLNFTSCLVERLHQIVVTFSHSWGEPQISVQPPSRGRGICPSFGELGGTAAPSSWAAALPLSSPLLPWASAGFCPFPPGKHLLVVVVVDGKNPRIVRAGVGAV